MSQKSKRSSTSVASPSLAGWQARSVHTLTLPSGQRVRVRIPGIGTILEHGDMPADLLHIALLEITTEGGATTALAQNIAAAENGDRDQALSELAQYGAFQRHLVASAIVAVEVDGEFVDVSLSLDEMDTLPEDDLAMVAEIVQRLRAHDARGVRIGVEPIDRWATFREAHGCPDTNCEGCTKLIAALSSADVGDV